MNIPSTELNQLKGPAMMNGVATLHMSETEVARDLHAVLAKVQPGVEIIIEQNGLPVAILKAPPTSSTHPGRTLSECIALAKEYEEKLGYAPVPDANFAQDVQASIDARRDSLKLPAWDWFSTPVL